MEKKFKLKKMTRSGDWNRHNFNFFSFEEKRLKHAQIQYRNAVILIAYDNLKFASFHCTMARPEGDAAASPLNPPLVGGSCPP